MLKNHFMNELFCPMPKKLKEKIQNLKLQCIHRHIFDKKITSCLLITMSEKNKLSDCSSTGKLIEI